MSARYKRKSKHLLLNLAELPEKRKKAKKKGTSNESEIHQGNSNSADNKEDQRILPGDEFDVNAGDEDDKVFIVIDYICIFIKRMNSCIVNNMFVYFQYFGCW